MPANTKYDNTPMVDCTSQEEEEEQKYGKYKYILYFDN